MGCGVVFYHPGRDVSCVVHGDDFTFCGVEEDLVWIEALMKSWFEVKVRAKLGPGKRDDKEVTILGRIVRWTSDGIEYEADPKHRKILLEKFGLVEGESRSLVNNGEKEWRNEEEWEEELLEGAEVTEFRGVTARLNFLSLDNPDLQFVGKEISREMAKPVRGSWKRMKKIVRYLLGRRSVVWKYGWQDEASGVEVMCDSDWGGRSGYRKSTSGGVFMIGKHCIKTWSASQGAVALSSAEAEFYAMIEGTLRAKGLLGLAREVGFEELDSVVRVATDSSAAKSFVSRRGLGKMRHIEVKELWLQQQVLKGEVCVYKIGGKWNSADLMTKVLTMEEVKDRLGFMNLEMTMK